MKKSLSLLLSFLLVVSSLCFPAAAFAASDLETDTLTNLDFYCNIVVEPYSEDYNTEVTYSFRPTDSAVYMLTFSDTSHVNDCVIKDGETVVAPANTVENTNYYALTIAKEYTFIFKSQTVIDGMTTVKAAIDDKTYQEAAYNVEDSYSFTLSKFDSDYRFTVTNGEVSIDAYTGIERDLEVPETIIGLPVTEIGFDSFTAMNLIILPESVAKIDFGAFSLCTSLKDITIHNKDCQIETEKEITVGTKSFKIKNGEKLNISDIVSADTITDLAASYGVTLPTLGGTSNPAYAIAIAALKVKIQDEIKKNYGYEFDEAGNLQIWTIPNTAVIRSKHFSSSVLASTAKRYAKKYNATFIGTDEHTIPENPDEAVVDCETGAVAKQACIFCDYTTEKTIEPKEHDFSDNAESCHVCGKPNPNYQPPAGGGGEENNNQQQQNDTQQGETGGTDTTNGGSTSGGNTTTNNTVTPPPADPATPAAVNTPTTTNTAPAGTAQTPATTKTTATVKKPTLTKVKAGKKQFTANWKKLSGVTGYQVQYSTSSKFTKKTTKTVTVKGAKKTSATVKKLKAGKKYYVRIRAYKGKAYSKWTSSKTVTPKK